MSMNKREIDDKLAAAERKARARRKVLLEGVSAEAMALIGEYVGAGLPVFRTHDSEGRLRTDVSAELLQLDAARRDGKLSVYHWLVMQRGLAELENS